jgi:hypothetical protein
VKVTNLDRPRNRLKKVDLNFGKIGPLLLRYIFV